MFGAVEGDDRRYAALIEAKASDNAMKSWLESRLTQLREAFKRNMAEIDIEIEPR